jgi:hypothetical protein
MEAPFTPELEAKLTHSAAQQGRNPDELVQDVLTRYFEEEAASGAALVEVMQASPLLPKACVGANSRKVSLSGPRRGFRHRPFAAPA